jgi:hypothetical protein
MLHVATSVEDHVDRLVAGTDLEGNESMRKHIAKVVATVPEQHLATLGSISIKPDKDPNTRGRYRSRGYSARTKQPVPASITFTPHVVNDEKGYHSEIRDSEKKGWLRRTGLPGVQATLHHEVGHHLYDAMNQKQHDAMWTEVGAQPEFKPPNTRSAQPIGPRFIRSNRSNMVNQVGVYGAYNEREAASELYAQHHGKYPTEASHIAFRHMTGGTDEDPGAS